VLGVIKRRRQPRLLNISSSLAASCHRGESVAHHQLVAAAAALWRSALSVMAAALALLGAHRQSLILRQPLASRRLGGSAHRRSAALSARLGGGGNSHHRRISGWRRRRIGASAARLVSAWRGVGAARISKAHDKWRRKCRLSGRQLIGAASRSSSAWRSAR